MNRAWIVGLALSILAGCTNGGSSAEDTSSTSQHLLRRPPDMNKQEWADWHEKVMREARHRKLAPQTESHLAPVKQRHHSED